MRRNITVIDYGIDYSNISTCTVATYFKKNGMKKTNLFGGFREKLRAFVVCNHFKRGILFAILINTLSMGVEYHQQVVVSQVEFL